MAALGLSSFQHLSKILGLLCCRVYFSEYRFTTDAENTPGQNTRLSLSFRIIESSHEEAAAIFCPHYSGGGQENQWSDSEITSMPCSRIPELVSTGN